MCSPGRRRAFKALGRRRHLNQVRVNKGLSPLVKGKDGKLHKTSASALGIKKQK